MDITHVSTKKTMKTRENLEHRYMVLCKCRFERRSIIPLFLIDPQNLEEKDPKLS